MFLTLQYIIRTRQHGWSLLWNTAGRNWDLNQICSAILNTGMYRDNRNPSTPTAMKIIRTGSIRVLNQPIIFLRDSWFCILMRTKLEDRCLILPEPPVLRTLERKKEPSKKLYATASLTWLISLRSISGILIFSRSFPKM